MINAATATAANPKVVKSVAESMDVVRVDVTVMFEEWLSVIVTFLVKIKIVRVVELLIAVVVNVCVIVCATIVDE